MNLRGIAPGSAQSRHVESVLLCGIDDHAFTTRDCIGCFFHLIYNLPGNNHSTVLVCVDEIVVLNAHTRNAHRASKIHGMHEGVRRANPVGEHLKILGDVR